MARKKTSKKVETVVEETVVETKVEEVTVEEIPYVELGSKVKGKFKKSESYSLDEFSDKIIELIDADILQALKSYGKDTNLEAAVKKAVSDLIALDSPGVKINK